MFHISEPFLTALWMFTPFPAAMQQPLRGSALDILPLPCHWPPAWHVRFNAQDLLAELWQGNLLAYYDLLLGLFEVNYVLGADRTPKRCQITAIKIVQHKERQTGGVNRGVISVSLHREEHMTKMQCAKHVNYTSASSSLRLATSLILLWCMFQWLLLCLWFFFSLSFTNIACTINIGIIVRF